jgi:hypothetical protein
MMFVVWMFVVFCYNGCVREPGKTRGAIGFALIFLCFVSLYQDKEMKRKDKKKILKYLGFEITTFGVWKVDKVWNVWNVWCW